MTSRVKLLRLLECESGTFTIAQPFKTIAKFETGTKFQVMLGVPRHRQQGTDGEAMGASFAIALGKLKLQVKIIGLLNRDAG